MSHRSEYCSTCLQLSGAESRIERFRIVRSLCALIGCDSDGDSESIFRDSTLV